MKGRPNEDKNAGGAPFCANPSVGFLERLARALTGLLGRRRRSKLKIINGLDLYRASKKRDGGKIE